eukprot:SAG11_NODE_24435_length_373_cov_0.945255_1_plen_82_part_10
MNARRAVSLRYLCTFVVSSALVVLILHWFLLNKVMASEAKSAKDIELGGAGKGGKKKLNLGFGESLRLLAADDYCQCVAMMV